MRRRFIAKPKRNAERILRGGASNIPSGAQVVAYTYTANEAGTVKSIKLDTGITSITASAGTPYVLVHVREGYNVNNISYPAITSDMYNPTADVLISGILTDNAVEDHKFNMIGRKLKTGDRLALIYYNSAGGEVTAQFEMSFSFLT